MISFHNFSRSIAALLFLFAIASCDRFNQRNNTDELSAYVAYTTHGVIPTEAPIDVKLAMSTGQSITSGAEIDQMIFSFAPAIKGQAFWIDNETIRFIPEAKLPPGTHFEASLGLGKLFPSLSNDDAFHFEFRTLPISFELKDLTLSPVESATKEVAYQLTGSIEFSETTTNTDVSQIIQASIGGKRLTVSTTSSGENTADFVIDRIERSKNKQELILSWDGSSMKSPEKGSKAFEIAAIDEFAVVGVERAFAGTPRVMVLFTDQIDPQQNLSGLIGFKGGLDFQLEVQNNVVTLIPSSRPLGEVEVFVASGVRSSTGKTIDFEYKKTIEFQQAKPEVKLIGKGVIMSGKSQLQLPFQTRGLKAVDVQVVKIFSQNILQFLQWNSLEGSSELKRVGRLVAAMRVALKPNQGDDWQTNAIDLSQLIENKEPAIYRVYLSFQKSYAYQNCLQNQKEFTTEKLPISAEEMKNWSNENYYDPEYYYPDNFNWSERADPCSDSYYYYEHFVAQNVLATNLGLIAKQADGDKKQLVFFVNQIETAEPVENAKVQLYDFQQQSIASGTTDLDGKVMLQVADSKPFVATASYSGHTTFLKMDEGSALPLSKFDVSGTNIENGQKVFMFGERGVYMPGDTIFVGLILRKRQPKLPDSYPVVLELHNSRNQLVASQTGKGDENGLYLFKLPTNPDAPTGAWTASALIGNQRYEKRIRVETIKPNRLKIQFNFPKEEISATESQLKVSLQADWLQGNPVADADVSVECFTSQNKTSFDGFKAYSFTDPSRNFYAEQLLVDEGKTSQTGQFRFELGLPDYANAPGKVNCRYVARVMSPGGDISSRSADVIFSPFDSYVGLETPEPTDGEYLLTDTTHHFKLVTVDAKGKSVPNKPLLVEVFKLDWSWWWSGDGTDNAAYVRTENAVLVYSKNLSSGNGKTSFNWKVNYPDWGNYFIRVTNLESGHRSGKTIYLDWPSWYSRNNRSPQAGASMLSLSLDKDKYQPGEKATLSFPSPAYAKVLVSIESGNRVLQSYWRTSSARETSIEIPVIKDYSPNVYVSITLLQAREQQQNDLPIRLYGTIPLFVDEPESVLVPVIQLPETLEPEQKFEVTVQEQKGKEMSYILAVVDEGLLDITNFKTPDPHQSFFSKEALGIKTWDIYDLVMGAYGGRIEQVFAIGGDEAVLNREKAMKSRFEPTVRILGPFKLKEGKKNTHEILMPNYIGAVRVFVVATSGEAFGSADLSRKVKKPLMVLATAPRYLRPGDEMQLPVTIFADYDRQESIRLKVQTTGKLQVSGSNHAERTAEKGEKTIDFKLMTSKQSGEAVIAVEALSEKDKAHHDIRLEVNNPNNLNFRTFEGFLQAGDDFQQQIVFDGEEANRNLKVAVSQLPVPNLEERISYLRAYPYGCLEQISSQGFAQLFLHKIMKLNLDDSLRMRNSVMSAIKKVESNQLPDGSLSYWSGTNMRNEWADVFANHFMFLAYQEGYPVKALFLSSAKKWQQDQARTWEPDYYDGLIANDLIQAYRLYVLALRGDPMLSQMNRLRENKLLSLEAAQLLSSAYSLAGQADAARELALGIQKRPSHQHEKQYVTFISAVRSKAIRLETMLRLKENDAAAKLAIEISNDLGSKQYLNTQAVAFGLYAYQLFASEYGNVERTKLTISDISGKTKIETDDFLYTKTLQPSNQSIRIENTGKSPVYCKIEQSLVPFAEVQQPISEGLMMDVQFVDLKGNKLKSLNLAQGETFEMQVDVLNKTDRQLDYLALNQVIAAGWEINNNSLYEINSGQLYDFRDIRHDRVSTFFSLAPGQNKRFSVQITAAYQGKYLLPASFCEDMYDHAIQARSKSENVQVTGK